MYENEKMIRARVLHRELRAVVMMASVVSFSSFVVCLDAPAEEITVMLINARSGKPLSKVQVSVSM